MERRKFLNIGLGSITAGVAAVVNSCDGFPDLVPYKRIDDFVLTESHPKYPAKIQEGPYTTCEYNFELLEVGGQDKGEDILLKINDQKVRIKAFEKEEYGLENGRAHSEIDKVLYFNGQSIGLGERFKGLKLQIFGKEIENNKWSYVINP